MLSNVEFKATEFQARRGFLPVLTVFVDSPCEVVPDGRIVR